MSASSIQARKILAAVALTAFSSVFLVSPALAEILPAPATVLPNSPADRMADNSKTQSALMARVVEIDCREGACMEEKLDLINGILRLEADNLREAKVDAGLQSAETPEEERRVIAEAKKDETFRLNDVRFTGNRSISSKELKPFFEPYLGRDVAMPAVQRAIEDVKKHYRQKGYLATYVYVPVQDIRQSGSLEIAVTEGRLGKLEVTGNKFHSQKAILNQFSARPGDLLHYNNFEHDLEGLNKHRDVKANVVLKPGAKPGTTDVELKVKDKNPVHVSVDMNNLGPRNTGSYRYGTTVSHENLTGRFDSLTGRAQIGADAYALAGDYNVPVNRYGTRLGAGASYAENQVGGDFEVLDIEGDATTWNVYATHPLIDWQGFRTEARLGFDVKDVENRILGFTSGQDKLRVLSTGLNFEEEDEFGRTYSPHSLNFGLDAFGATADSSETTSSIGAGGEFFIYRGSLVRRQYLPRGMALTGRSTGQWTSDHLPPSEQMRLGGAYSVRGYPEAEYLGDWGIQGTLELSIPIDVLTKPFPDSWTFPFTKQPLNKSVEFVLFVDGGVAGSSEPLLGEEERRYLAGGGAGFRIRIHEKLYARLEWAGPLSGDKPRDARNSAFYFGVSYDLI